MKMNEAKTFEEFVQQGNENKELKERYIQITHMLDTANFLADMSDAFMKDAHSRMMNVGVSGNKADKARFTDMKFQVERAREKATRCFRDMFRIKDEEKYILIVDKSHLLYQLMKLIVNRTTNKNEGLQEIYDTIKALPIKRNVFDETHL